MGELLADHTTLRLGGPADRFLTHTDPAAWPDLAHAARGGDAAPFVLGGGSNTLADDTGYPGAVVRMATRGVAVRPLSSDLVEVIVQAGEPLDSLVAFTVAEGLSGIEYLGGIPGTAGAAPVQNTGAYGQQISEYPTPSPASPSTTGTSAAPASCIPAIATSVTAPAHSRPIPDDSRSSRSACV